MTSPLDPLRRAAQLRRARKAQSEAAEEAQEAVRAGLPVPVEPAQTTAPAPPLPAGATAFDAHLLGQDGQKRGLRAGPQAIDTAAATYNRTEWSGSKDRRARKGRITKTEI